MARLKSSKEVSTSAVHKWVIQDVKILLDHFSDEQILSHLVQAEENLQGEDMNRISKIKNEDKLTGTGVYKVPIY